MGIDFSNNNPRVRALQEETKDENVLSSEVGRYYNKEKILIWEKFLGTNDQGEEILKTRIYNVDNNTWEEKEIDAKTEEASIKVTEESMSPILRDIQKKTQDNLFEDLDS